MDKKMSELKKEQVQFERIFCATRDFVSLIDKEYRYVLVNDAYLRLNRARREELIGHTVAEHLGDAFFTGQLKDKIDTCLTNQIIEYRIWYDFQTAGRRCLDVTYSPYLNEQGEVTGVIASGRDITDQAETIDALQTSRERLELMAKAGNIGLWDWDLQTNKVYFSPEWKRQIGYLDHEITDDYREWESRVHPDDLARATATVQSFLKNPCPGYKNEYRFRHRDGAYRWILTTASLVNDEKGRLVRMLGSHIDVTDRREEEEVLRQSAETLRRAQAAAGIGSWWYDPTTQISQWTDEMFRIFHLPVGAQIPSYSEYKNLFHSDDWEMLDAAVTRAVEEARRYNLELRIIRPDGQTRHVNSICEPVKTDKGTVRQLIGTLQDITDRKAAEAALLAGRQKYQSLFESIRDSILVVDTERTIVECNQAFLETFGYDKEHILGKNTLYLYSDERQFQEMGKAIKDHRGEKNFVYTVNYKKKSGEIFPGETGVFYLKDTDGNISGMIGLIRDVSERKKREDQVRKSEARFRTMVENLFDAVVVINKDGTIRFVNCAACQLFDRMEDQLVGSAFGFPVSVGEAQEIDIILKKGTVRHAEIKVAMAVWDGEPIHLASIRDVTDKVNERHKRAEIQGQLQQIQKLEAIGTLAGGIAHDFNNILTPILGFTQLAQERVKYDEQTSECLAEVFQAACRAKDLVGQILAFSRQSKDIEYQPLMVEPIIKEVLKLLRSALPSTIELKKDIQCKGVILGGATEIHQILMNLCTNAKHAMELSGGVLHISLHNVQLDEARALSVHPDLHAGSYVHLRVRDTGHGIERAVLEKIFEPYFTTKEQDKGTGLGLSVVHGIVSNHGGVISVDSLVGKGTTFDVYLPRIVTQDVPDTVATVELPTGTEHILLVDDEPSILRLNSRILQRLGYKVTTRASSIEALALFAARPDDFDIILTDMTMPVMRGDQLAEQCLVIRPDIPIVLVTGFSEIITEEKACKIGIKSILMKPSTKVEIATVVRSALQPFPSKRQENRHDS